MLRPCLIIFLFLLSDVSSAQPEPPLRHVDHVLWVVDNMKTTIKGWKEIGFTGIADLKKISVVTHGRQDESGTARVGEAHLASLNVVWIQPVKGNNIFSRQLQQHGAGAFALIHRVEDRQTLQRLLNEYAQKNIGKIASFTIKTPEGDLHYILLDTMEKGKYFMGFLVSEFTPGHHIADQQNTALEMRFSQYAFAIKDPQPVSDFWEKAGLPAFQMTHPENWDKQYFGMAANYDMKLGWQRHGDIVYEWCIPLAPPNVYSDHIRKHGEGLQHFAFQVNDMDAASRFFESHGYKISQSGGWGQKGKPGSGRFAYVDLEKIGGMTVELLWNYKQR